MSGTQEDGSRSVKILSEDASSDSSAVRSPVLSGISEAELDDIVSQLRTDKSLTIAPVPAASDRLGARTEQLLLGAVGALGLFESQVAREEAARHTWYIALGERVTGPLPVAELRTHWERGELSPDSLCWRKGFEDWRRVCQVPGLAETLAPRTTTEPSRPEDLVPVTSPHALDFPLKGAEAVRILAEDVPPPLPARLPAHLPPMLEPEPVTAPALEPEPDTLPEAPRAQDAAGTHEVLPARPPTQVEVRVRGGAWLALGGGLVGGMLVVFLVWLLGLSGVLSVYPRGALSGGSASTGTAESAASASSSASTLAAPKRVATAAAPASPAVIPAPAASKPDATAAATTNPATMTSPTATTSPAALPGPLASRPDTTGLVPGIGSGSSLGEGALTVTRTLAPAPLTRSAPAGGMAAEAPKRVAAVVRPVAPDPSMRKPAKTEVSFDEESKAEPGKVASTATMDEEDEEDEDLGLDEEFARELDDPSKRAVPAKRTAWIPPAPPPSTEVPASLVQSDIFSVVVANKSDITACVSAQKLQSEQGNRRVVVRWTILPSGRVTDVVTETATFQGTPLALCLEEKIRSWTFPRHREQGGPVRFPFVF